MLKLTDPKTSIARSANGRPDGPGPSNPRSNRGWAAKPLGFMNDNVVYE